MACTTLWGCPLCKNTFSGKAIQRKHIATCQELPQPMRQKEFFCPKEGCDKKYVDQEALDHHIADHEGRIIHSVCQYCGKQLSTQSALNLLLVQTSLSHQRKGRSPKGKANLNLNASNLNVLYTMIFSAIMPLWC